MKWPQVIWLVLAAVMLVVALAVHGKPKEGEHSFYRTLLLVAINVALLLWGGFFS